MSVQRLHVSQRFSEIAIAGNLVHLAGQLATDLDLDIKGQTQQTLDILQQHIDQTPTETKALAMVNIFENKGKEGGVLITPKNQQTAFWGENQNKEKTLLVTAPESLPQLQQTPKRK